MRRAGLIGISRLSWSLAEHRQLPGVFARLHRRYRTPWFTILVFSALAGLLLLPGQTDFLGNLYSFGAMLSFTTAHVSVIALRVKEPDRERPYRAPWNVRVRGRSIPLTAVVGALGTSVAFVTVVVLHTEARTVGIAWMALGLVAYFVYRRRAGLEPRAEYRIDRGHAPTGFKELAYRSALVPIFGGDVDAHAMRSAVKLVGEGAAVDAVYVLTVPSWLHLDSGLDDEEQMAEELLTRARTAGRQAGVEVRTSLITTRNPGAAIVDEAERRGSKVVYLSTVHAPPNERALGPTATYLLEKRPCRVVIESDGAVPELR